MAYFACFLLPTHRLWRTLSRMHKHNPLEQIALPVPFGAQPTAEGTTFTLLARDATRVWLLLFESPDADTPSREIELNPAHHRVGDIWHVHVPEAKAGQYYVYRLDGQSPPPIDHTYDPAQWVLDPYAMAVAGAPQWGDPHGLPAGTVPRHGAAFPKGVIVDHAYDWGDDRRPATPLADTIIYEAHVRGYTAHPHSGVAHPGTYRGLIEKIPYLQSLGVTALELLPLQEFDEMEYYRADDPRRELRNLWGYSTLNFFAPNGRYAHTGVTGGQVTEFKDLVRAAHQAGLEVILDVVFNHTAEGGQGGPVYSFRGLDPAVYYMIEEDGRTYRNFTGCGNTVNCNHPVVMGFILDSLRHWVRHYHIDGFRFDLASIFTRGANGEVLAKPPIVDAITEDPLLRGTKWIAEAWDAAGLYQVGSFPHPCWSEWNGRYRDDVRQFWRGGPGQLSALATRLAGSADLYDAPDQRPLKSINFVTAHDGFTLADLVSYDQKHNEANLEENRDGDNHNHSHNYGTEGPTDDPSVGRLRKRQVKNFLATLLCSQGVPLLLGGDEFFRSQQGNNNAYCQDNEIAWIDWSLAETHKDLVEFTRQLIAFRREHPSLRRRSFLKGCHPEGEGGDICWFGTDGQPPNWDHDATVGCLLNGGKDYTGADVDKDHLLLIFHAGPKPITFQLPPPPGGPWQVRLSTQEEPPRPATHRARLELDGRSVTILTSSHD